ncbi:DUF2490 domain-containing protein [Reichenbachiella carrageenanivorans]|uniref:DUF2490 domain-containing protein n=1 Tax=Reichenbachiella carrageenanivorans TaxID=2979869 RepID=A0ABY6D403_9BACT|nr:DUF2490 domain-containing protein [Reichenbachiella carrageenanivorans]UXX80860.1 DUF2490 domain-containing protein [Reichenbachiella carrageenanivorans]
MYSILPISLSSSPTKWLISLIIALAFSTLTQAQSNNDIEGASSQQIWIDLSPHFKLGEQTKYIGDFGFRKIVDDDSWARIFLRPAVRHQLNEILSIQADIGVSYDWSKNNIDYLIVTPRQGIKLDWPSFVRFSFSHLIRIEERFSYQTSDWSHTLNLRIRYKLDGTFDFKLRKTGNFWFLPFYAEVFLGGDDDTHKFLKNRVRSGVGLGYDPANTWQYIFLANWQNSISSDEYQQISDIIYQLKIKKTIGN